MSNTSNTVKTDTDIEVYTNDIYYYADQYIESELDGDKDLVNDYFVDMLFYIVDHIPVIDTSNVPLMNHIFNIYIRLCGKYKYIPTLEGFSILLNRSNITLSVWASSEDNGHGGGSANPERVKYLKRWKEICKSFAVNKLFNKDGANANLIFGLKAGYGMVEAQAPRVETESRPVLSVKDLQLLLETDKK